MKKLNINEIKLYFEKNNWKLLSTEYQNSRSKLDVICDNGHKTQITWNNFQRGQRCGVCCNNKKFSIEYVKKQFNEFGFKLLDDNYVNNNKPVLCECSCGNTTKMALCSVKQGHKCNQCKSDKLSKIKSAKADEIITFLNKNNLKYISHFVSNHRTRVKCICVCGNEFESNWDNLQRTKNCNSCGIKKKSGCSSVLWQPDRVKIKNIKNIQKRCYNLVKRSLSSLNLKKDKPKRFLLGYSTKELYEHIFKHPLYNPKISFHIDHIFPVSCFINNNMNDMKLINNLSNLRPIYDKFNLKKKDNFIKEAFNIWIQNPTISAEYTINNYIINDVKTNCPRSTLILPGEHHQYKNNWFYIMPHEWSLRKNNIIQRYNIVNGVSVKNRIMARKCAIKTIDVKTWNRFCNEYHFQGANKLSKISIGLYLNDELIAGISLGRHHRGLNLLVLDRLCYKHDYHVSGGSERLLKYAIDWAKTKGYNQIVSFSDKRYSDGFLYERLGFKKDKEYNPDYQYLLKSDFSIGFSKQNQNKTSSKCPVDITEKEWALRRGLVRIYDMGKTRWIINI